jgi:hypothetical protein
MKSFFQYIAESSTTTKHTVGRGNRSGIGRVKKVTPSHTNEVRDTIYHHPHEDGERHISVTFSSHEPKRKKHHDSEEMITGVHDSTESFHKGETPAVLSKRGTTKAHHQLKHESKKHSILHHHLSNTNAHTVTSTTAREYDRDTGELKPGMGRKGNITARKSKRTPHPNWTYSNDSEHAISTNSETVNHTWTRNKK